MTDSRPITLLHLSDLQFGKNHKFARVALPGFDSSFDTLLVRLTDDLKILKRDHGLDPDLVVLTGDLAEWSLPSEYNDLEKFLTGLIETLGLARDRVVMVPGNHDISRKACESYFSLCESDENCPEPPYWPKWNNYAKFFNSFYEGVPNITFQPDMPWTLYEVSPLKLVVAGLNSTWAESHRDHDHYGLIGERQLRWFAEKLKGHREKGWLRIGAVHHNVRRRAKDDDENLRDEDDLQRLLGPWLNVILHGHTHMGALDCLTMRTPILATGSAALKKEARPEELPNQYQFIRIGPDRIWRWTRAYAPERKEWIGDTRGSVAGDRWSDEQEVRFDGVDGTFPKPERSDSGRRARTELHDRERERNDERQFQKPNDFLEDVARICRMRNANGAQVERVDHGLENLSYLKVTERRETVIQLYPVGVEEHGVSEEALGRWLKVHRTFRDTNTGFQSELVYRGEPAPSALVKIAVREGVRLVSFVEFQGLIDFRPYLKDQTARLAADLIYPPDLYVRQRMLVPVGREEQRHDDALTTLRGMLDDPHGRFILVLGDFGTGKTFLLHELARRMGEENAPAVVPVLVEMRGLDKGLHLDELIAQHFARWQFDGVRLSVFRYMLREGRIALLLDGFDELAVRVTFDRAADHLRTILEAVTDKAKVVVTSRTQHFINDKQIKTALGEQVEQVAGRRIVRLLPFGPEQIKEFRGC
jgi:3',5'-cyclic AMP phosphodiesterase CpdA